MGKIQILDEHIANQIAAGEVVERPASVVKELVENAVDAGSSRIDVSIEEGGLQLIRVTDNGNGMDATDSELAFYRHATSKIKSSKDLFSIRTLGFRGEALPSISAVAKVECITSSENSGLGRKIVIEGGNVKVCEDTTASKGTDMLVRELFFNTPARLKYMKTIQTELSHISDYMYRLALAHPNIAFTLRHNGNVLLQTLGNGDLLQVIAAIYGITTAKDMIAVEGESLDYKLKGYVSKPEMTRANRSAISFIVNGRYIKNFALAHALLHAYHTLLPINRFPLAVLQIEMDPALVDVNVHPAKLEVRFSKEGELIQFIEERVRTILSGLVHIPQATKPAGKKDVIQEQLAFYRSDHRTSERSDSGIPPKADNKPQSDQRPDRNEQQNRFPKSSPNQTTPAERVGERPKPTEIEKMVDLLQPAHPDNQVVTLPDFPNLYPIGQMHGTYIVAQNETGLFLIDQHAAHERINYEYYFEKFANPAAASQQLLVPITLEFTPSDAEIIKEKSALFEQVGVYIDYFGGNTFIVRAYPHWFPAGEEKMIVEEMAEWILAERKQVDLRKLREKAAIMCSCKASIKANQSLGVQEMEALLDKLAHCRNPYTCPHGRPIVVSFSTYELEKMFKRVM